MNDFFSTVVDHWPAGRRDLHWHILFDPDQVARELVAPYRELTHRPGIAPVLPQWAHLTVLHSGPENETAEAEITTIVERVRQACAGITPFDITLDRPTVGRTAIVCAGRPGAPAHALWDLTAHATADVVGHRWPTRPAVYWPHMALGYGIATTAPANAAEMKAWLSDHGTGPVTLRADRLSLVAQWHDNQAIVWEHLADVPLAGA